jgi:hypothetical protein
VKEHRVQAHASFEPRSLIPAVGQKPSEA